jgi:hypothetical protein
MKPQAVAPERHGYLAIGQGHSLQRSAWKFVATTTASRRDIGSDAPLPPSISRAGNGIASWTAARLAAAMSAWSTLCRGAVAKLLKEIGDVVDPAGQFCGGRG